MRAPSRALGAALVLGLGLMPPSAAAQDVDAARLQRLLERWTELERRASTPTEAPVRPLVEASLADPHELWCRTQPWSCECGGLPAGPGMRYLNPDEVSSQILACAEHPGRRAARGPVGGVRVELTVGEAGRVLSSRLVSNETGDAGLGGCVARALRSVRVSFWSRNLRFPIRVVLPVVSSQPRPVDRPRGRRPLRAPMSPQGDGQRGVWVHRARGTVVAT